MNQVLTRAYLATPVLVATIDRCAAIRAQIDALNDEKTLLEAQLVASGLDKIDGTLHTVSISRDLSRETTDWKGIALRFEPSRQLITANTKVGSPYNVVRYSARKLPS